MAATIQMSAHTAAGDQPSWGPSYSVWRAACRRAAGGAR